MNRLNTNQILCRYYINGACRKGDSCRFSHTRSDQPSSVCRYYQRGRCAYGTACRYDHIRDSNHSSSIANSNSSIGSSRRTVSNKSPPRSSSTRLKTSNLSAEAAEFVPGNAGRNKTDADQGRSYSRAVAGDELASTNGVAVSVDGAAPFGGARDLLCPYNVLGHCWYGDHCSFLHGHICDLCNLPALHPTDTEHNAKHRQECLAEHEREMESAFAQAKSREKQCGICMEVVLEKSDTSKRRFGVLPSCKHCFCLDCIRQWRKAKSFENKVIRACPECRTVSDYVIPSSLWVDDDTEKGSLIESYHTSMKRKTCKYFDRTKSSSSTTADECPFGNKCFYKHVDSEGREVRGDSPNTVRRRQRERQRRQGRGRGNGGASTADLFALWSFVTARDGTNSDDGAGRSRHSSSNGVSDWLWDELEYELHMLDIGDYDYGYYDSSDSDF